MVVDTIILICIIIALVFNALGVIGIIRFPDVYTRLHAETKTTTFGMIFLGIAVILYALFSTGSFDEGISLSFHAAVAVIVLMLTNATGSHAIARGAYKSGQKPDPQVTDKLSEVEL